MVAGKPAARRSGRAAACDAVAGHKHKVTIADVKWHMANAKWHGI
jgi:hypothetical protein